MRAWLVVCAALALAPCRATAARAPQDPARLERIKSHILAKLGLTSRPMPLGAPPRDVVQEILHRAQDSQPQQEHRHDSDHAMREIIAIAQTDFTTDFEKKALWINLITSPLTNLVREIQLQQFNKSRKSE